MSIVVTDYKAMIQAEISALEAPVSPSNILSWVNQCYGLGLDLSKLEEVLNSAFTLVDGNTSKNDKVALNAARQLLEKKAEGLSNREVITSSKFFTVPDNVYSLYVTLVGGGDRGNSAYGSGRAGSGGNAGAVLLKWRVDVTPGQRFHAVIGAGGSESTSAGNTTFAGLIAKAGAGKKAQTTPVTSGMPTRGAEGFQYGVSGFGAGYGGDGTGGYDGSYGYYRPGGSGLIIVEWA